MVYRFFPCGFDKKLDPDFMMRGGSIQSKVKQYNTDLSEA